MPKVITITAWESGETGIGGFGGFEVEMNGLVADGLNLGEMFEQLLGLIKPARHAYPMKTPSEIRIARGLYFADLDAPCDPWPYYASKCGEIPF